MVTSLEEVKAFDKIKHALMIKVLERPRIQGTILNIIKVAHSKPTANINLHGEKLKPFSLKPGLFKNKKDMSFTTRVWF